MFIKLPNSLEYCIAQYGMSFSIAYINYLSLISSADSSLYGMYDVRKILDSLAF